MDVARARLAAAAAAGGGVPHGALVVADAQTAGAGRRGRRWESPAGGGDLYFTFVWDAREAGAGAITCVVGGLGLGGDNG
jgi:BirA family biotin operon repressor/biotin-[acetyl-CoA-carboxylase] ligase